MQRERLYRLDEATNSPAGGRRQTRLLVSSGATARRVQPLTRPFRSAVGVAPVRIRPGRRRTGASRRARNAPLNWFAPGGSVGPARERPAPRGAERVRGTHPGAI